MTHPAVVLSVLILAAVLVAHATGRRHVRVQPDTVDPRQREWARAVAARMPEAFNRVQLPTVAAKGDREPPRLTAGAPIGTVGWSWRIQTPGGATIEHVRERSSQLASALNRPTPLVAVVDAQRDPVHEGWGTMRVYRRDPIHTPRPIGEVAAPGATLMAHPGGTMLVGVTRWGDPVRLPLAQHHAFIAGQNAAGKSSAVSTIIANVLPHVEAGTVRLHLVDTGKLGKGYHALHDGGWFASWSTDPDDAVRTVERLRRELVARTTIGGDGDVPITTATPIEVVIVEEAPTFVPHKGAAQVLESFARQTRQMGGVLIVVSQGGLEMPVTLRRQLRTKVGFRLADATETRNVMDVASLADGAPGPHTIPATTGVGGTVDWRGVSFVDPDGIGSRMVRWWWVDQRWLSAHAAAVRATHG